MGTENIKLGPCRVSWNGSDLGLTKGGVELSISTAIDDKALVGQYAQYDPMLKSLDVKVTCPLAESTAESLQCAFPWGTLTTAQDGTRTFSLRDFSGKRMRQYSKALVVTPTNSSDTFSIACALPISQTIMRYSTESERTISVTFIALPDNDGTLITFPNW